MSERPDAILAHGLAIGYRGDVVVEGIDLRVAPGTSLALVGTNGSGKSTLLKTLVGLQERQADPGLLGHARISRVDQPDQALEPFPADRRHQAELGHVRADRVLQ